MTNVVVHMPVHPALFERLEQRGGLRLTVVPHDQKADAGAEPFRSAEILFCYRAPENLRAMKNLRFVQLQSAGYELLFDQGLEESGVRAANGRGLFEIAIAEWNIGMMVNLNRDLRAMIRNQEQGLWAVKPAFQRELRGATVGLWGYGGIGRETARQAKAMGLNVHVLARQTPGARTGVYQVPGTGDPEGRLPDQVFLYGQEQEFLRGLDFLILAMPLTRRTEGLLGERELRWLPRHAYLLNPSRGPLVQEQALLKALREGWIAGAALDTHYYYPMPPDHPLWRFPNVIMTPHISGSSGSQYFLERVWDIFSQNVERYRQGEPLINELTLSQLRGE